MKFLFGSGIVSAITAASTLLRGSKNSPITWRAVLAWLSWGITFALAVGTAIDANRAKRGLPIDDDSPIAAKQAKEREKKEKQRAKERKRASR